MNDDEVETRWREMQEANLLPRLGFRARVANAARQTSKVMVLLAVLLAVFGPGYLAACVITWWWWTHR